MNICLEINPLRDTGGSFISAFVSNTLVANGECYWNSVKNSVFFFNCTLYVLLNRDFKFVMLGDFRGVNMHLERIFENQTGTSAMGKYYYGSFLLKLADTKLSWYLYDTATKCRVSANESATENAELFGMFTCSTNSFSFTVFFPLK